MKHRLHNALVRQCIIEYACPVWQSSLTVDQLDRLEVLQRRAMKILSGSDDYELYSVIYNIEPIYVRLDTLARSFFNRMSQPTDCLFRLLPTERNTETINRLRRATRLPTFQCRTTRFFNSFLPYALRNYQ